MANQIYCREVLIRNVYYVQALSCLVQMAAVRRSLFDNAERAKFLNHVVSGVKRILGQNSQVLNLI